MVVWRVPAHIITLLAQKSIAVWNMGAIAASDYPDRLLWFRNILVASASAPGLFAPAYTKPRIE
jgi:hypothetical protein